MDMDRDTLLSKLTELDFMAVDLALFLDTHPDNAQALAQYNKTIEAADAVRAKYEQLYGPLCSFRSYGGESWNWIDAPWPWKKEFNYNINSVGSSNGSDEDNGNDMEGEC